MAYMPDPFTYHTRRPRLLYVATVHRDNILKRGTPNRRVRRGYHVTKGSRRYPDAYTLFCMREITRRIQ
jgi:hypothetical protein